ncbi:hypothetical protein WJX74_006629 [Apatococcus lobatus]|uniref:FHA domain-containing protein n=1 Tax=Apatococcus lobatus TaxID=904363 RepID=A0AAW1RSV5_9CHLO
MEAQHPLKRGAEQAGLKADNGSLKRQKSASMHGDKLLSEAQLLKRRIRRQARLLKAYEEEGQQLYEELQEGYNMWKKQAEGPDDSKTAREDKSPQDLQSAPVEVHQHGSAPAGQDDSKDSKSDWHKLSLVNNHMSSPPAFQPPKLLAHMAAPAQMEASQGSNRAKPKESITAIFHNESGQSTNSPQPLAQTKDGADQLQAHPMLQERRGDVMHKVHGQPQDVPARPSSAFAAMAGRALEASGSLSGSFSRELPYRATTGGHLRGTGSSGRRLQSFDSAVSSNSRLEGLQQAICRDTSSSEDDADATGAHGETTGQDLKEDAAAHGCIIGSQDALTFKDQLPTISRREQGCSVASARELDKCSALAALCGNSTRFLLHRTAISIGRSSDLGQVDLDLGNEQQGAHVCRKQAQLALKSDGHWRLTNTGRRCVHINGNPCRQGQSVHLHHLSLLQMGGVNLMFMENQIAVRRVVSRTVTLAL